MNFTINTYSSDSVKKSFSTIANELINKYELKINDRIYQFIDIEFYFFCKVHKDGFTMNHSRNIGELEAHRYGIDISIGNLKDFYGGILIKSLLNKTDIITKSQIKNELINNFLIGKNEIVITKRQNPTGIKLFQTEREKLGQIDNIKNRTQEFKDAKYRYVVYNKEIFRKYKGKENLLKKSNLSSNEIQELIGYKLAK